MNLLKRLRVSGPLSGLLIAVLFMVFLAACGTDTASGGSSTPTAGATSTPTTAPTSTPGTTPTVSAPAPTPQATPVPPSGSTGSACAGQGGLISIRMITHTQGWALNEKAILRTTDGGAHWKCVTPANVQLGRNPKGDFLTDGLTAWVIPTTTGGNTITMLHTTNGGQSWQTSTISDDQPEAIEPPHFLNANVGYLEVSNHGGPAAGSEAVDIFKSTDAGHTWLKVSSTDDASSGLSRGGIKSGISFADTQNGWATGEDASDTPWLYVTHNGGKTWSLQTLPGISVVAQLHFSYIHVTTTPPVFFGSTGLLPAHISGTQSNGTQVLGFTLYVSHDGGASWNSTWATRGNAAALTSFDTTSTGLYIASIDHAWAGNNNDGSLYRTVNSGDSWQKVASGLGQIYSMSFVDNSYGWVLGNNGLFRTTDGGSTWQQVFYQYV